ncbi:MAG TPA: hypothetical protein VNJ01_05615 [Bacteriovoracaceae bacterium]|nr:hypothetical protein [Bacteriovoracaceae bacterium]
MNSNTLQVEVYFNTGKGGAQPWHVGLREGKAITEIYGQFADALVAIHHAQRVCEGLPVTWPKWLKVVLQ